MASPKELKKSPETQDLELTPRWADFIKLYLETGNAYKAALSVGFSEPYAAVITTRFPEKVRKSLSDALENKGIDSDSIAEKIKWLLNQDEPNSVDKGITHAIKIGIGGGYAAEKHVNVNVTVNPEAEKKAQEFEEWLKTQNK